MSSNQNTERVDEIVCLYKFTGVFHDYIYFELSEKNANNTDIAIITIRTAWLINYENKLKNYIIDHYDNDNDNQYKITILSKDELKNRNIEKCDWKFKASMQEFGVDKGSILSWASNNDTSKITSKAISIAKTSLDDNYPAVEISLAVILPFVGLIIIAYVCEYIKKKKNNTTYHSC